MSESDDPYAQYLHDGTDVHFVGGPLDGQLGAGCGPTTFWSYLHDDGAKAGREDFRRTPNAHGYVHWCGHAPDTGDNLHAYVHGSMIGAWLERWDAVEPNDRNE
jgi:hypothetical protein